MSNTAEVIQFERPVVKADIDNGFDRVAGTLTDTLMNPPVKLSAREYQVIHAIISKTYRYHKKTDWIASIQLSELTGISQSNISKIKMSLLSKNVIVQEGKRIGINPIISDWVESKTVKNDCNKDSQKRLSKQSKTTNEQSKTTAVTVKNDCNNRKTILQKTITTIDKPARKKSTSKIPLDFSVTETMQAWAIENQISVNLKTETEQFIDHYTAKGESRADWVASWRTWMRNSKKYSPAKQSFSNRKTFADQRTERNMQVLNDFVIGDDL